MIATYPLDTIWPRIEPKIDQLHAKWGGNLDWEPWEVKAACSLGRAFIFCDDVAPADNFCIAKVQKRGGRDVLFIWIAYGENGRHWQNVESLKEIARHAGVQSVEWESRRPGFDRMPGVSRVMTRYGMEV